MKINHWRTVEKEYEQGTEDPLHTHADCQILFASKGMMLVFTDSARWLIAPQQAVWLPAFQPHSIKFLTNTRMRSVYLDISEFDFLINQSEPRVSSISSFSRELIYQFFQAGYDNDCYRLMSELLLKLILQGNKGDASFGLSVQLPKDELLLRIANRIIRTNHWNISLEAVAKFAKTSPRNFSRKFQKDIGSNFRHWKQKARIAVAIDYLCQGLSIKETAYRLGFSSASTFSTSFSETVGFAPSALFSHQGSFSD